MKCNKCVNSLKSKTGVPSCWLPRCMDEWDNDTFCTTQRWRALRARALRRDKYLCVECKQYGKKVPATTVHHVKERSEFPELEYDINNLECLCFSCHNKKHPEKGKKQKADINISPHLFVQSVQKMQRGKAALPIDRTFKKRGKTWRL